jgi:hypothetical protein
MKAKFIRTVISDYGTFERGKIYDLTPEQAKDLKEYYEVVKIEQADEPATTTEGKPKGKNVTK